MKDVPIEAEEDAGELRLAGPLRLACAEVECWKCGKSTTVSSLEAAMVEDVEAGSVFDDSGGPSFLSNIDADDMPLPLAEKLSQVAPHYRPVYSRTLGDTTWANACMHCDALQGQFYLHMEPDGPFFYAPGEFEGEWQALSDIGAVLRSGSYSHN